MVASWTEPEWDEEQVELVIAEHFVRNNTGPNGEWLPEAVSRPEEGADPMAYSGYRYVADGPLVNWAEKARLDEVEKHRKALGENPDMNGKFWTVRKIEY